MSTTSAPIAYDILIPSPVQCGPLEVGKCLISDLYFVTSESGVPTSAPYPPVAKITGPYS